LLIVIACGTFVIVGVAVTGFVVFTKFLRKEKTAAERFRAMHKSPPDER